MPKSILRRLLGRAGAVAPQAQGEAFSLPGALGPGARVLLLASEDFTDLLFAMPLVDRLHADVPGVQIGLVCDERTSHLALTSDRFSDVIVVEEEHLQPQSPARKGLERVLADEPWNVAILLGLHADPARDELAYFSGATLRVGPDHPRAYPHLNCEVRPPMGARYPYDRATVWGRLLGLQLDGAPLRWTLDEKRKRQMQQLVHFNKPRKEQRLVAVDPGLGKDGSRVGPENLAHIVNHLARTIDSRAMILSADPDPTPALALRAGLQGDPLDLPRPTLLETILLLGQSQLLVSGNTDLLHFAAAMDVPTLAIFTPDDGEHWLPTRAGRLSVVRPQPGVALDLADLMDKVERLLV